MGVGIANQISRITIFQTLNFQNLSITRTKSHFPSLVKHYIFTLGFLEPYDSLNPFSWIAIPLWLDTAFMT